MEIDRVGNLEYTLVGEEGKQIIEEDFCFNIDQNSNILKVM